VQFGALQVTPRACYTRPPTELPNTDGFIEVDEITLQGEVKRIFTGWMFAASPGLHGVEHPIYDVWLTDCRPDSPQLAGAQPPAQPAAASAVALVSVRDGVKTCASARLIAAWPEGEAIFAPTAANSRSGSGRVSYTIRS
jgi:hypothetical protein